MFYKTGQGCLFSFRPVILPVLATKKEKIINFWVLSQVTTEDYSTEQSECVLSEGYSSAEVLHEVNVYSAEG